MNTSLVKSAPQGDFTEISVMMKGWEAAVQTLVSQNRPIKYDMYPRPEIPREIQNRLREHGYHDLIVESDRWQHFLVPHLDGATMGASFAGGRSTKTASPS